MICFNNPTCAVVSLSCLSPPRPPTALLLLFRTSHYGWTVRISVVTTALALKATLHPIKVCTVVELHAAGLRYKYKTWFLSFMKYSDNFGLRKNCHYIAYILQFFNLQHKIFTFSDIRLVHVFRRFLYMDVMTNFWALETLIGSKISYFHHYVHGRNRRMTWTSLMPINVKILCCKFSLDWDCTLF